MWTVKKFAATAMAGAGLAVAAATPASACFDWGYSGLYSYGWPYATTGLASYPAYGYRSCGGYYNIPGWGECGGYGACGWAPLAPPVVAVPVEAAAAAAPVAAVVAAAPGPPVAAGRPRLARRTTRMPARAAAPRGMASGTMAEARGTPRGH